MLIWRGKTISKFNLQWIIWWGQLACKWEWTPLSITKLGWSIKIKSMQEEDWERICVGSVISWWSPWDEETDSRSISSVVEISPCHWKFDLQLKSPSISLKAGLLKLMSYYLIKAWQKIFKVAWRLWWGTVDYKNITRFIIYCNLAKNRFC